MDEQEHVDLERRLDIQAEQEPNVSCRAGVASAVWNPLPTPAPIEDLGYCAVREELGNYLTCACGATFYRRRGYDEHLAGAKNYEALFDHIATCGGALDLWECVSPGALESLVTWARGHQLELELHNLDGFTRTTKAILSGDRGLHQITVFHRDPVSA